MKFNKKISILGVLLLILLGSCTKRDLTPVVGPVNLKIKLEYDSIIKGFGFPIKGIHVKILNEWTSKQNEASSDQDGMAFFQNISGGQYKISASITIDKDQYNLLTGRDVEEDVTINGGDQLLLLSTPDTASKVVMKSGNVGDWVFKQIYYAGSHSQNGASFRDQFLEIYNNTDRILYADSLYIGQVVGTNATNPNLASGYYITSGVMTGQFNWNKSIGMPGNINGNDYVYVKSLYRIPGDSTTYRVMPGESIVLAQTAVNHKAPYSNSTGGQITIKDPSLTVDLSKADFEVYLAPYLSVPLASDISNPEVPKLIMLDYSGKDWIFDPGREGFVLFKTDVDIPTTYRKYPDPTVTAITANTTVYYQIPSDLIIDAVEIQPNTPAARVPKRLDGKLDGGYTYVPAGSYSSQSLIRKTSKVVNGRKILRDTNNSTNDFDYLDRALPKAFK